VQLLGTRLLVQSRIIPIPDPRFAGDRGSIPIPIPDLPGIGDHPHPPVPVDGKMVGKHAMEAAATWDLAEACAAFGEGSGESLRWTGLGGGVGKAQG
jgi:hypothetical protein